MRPLLALETSGSSLGVALRAETGIVFEENVTAGSIHGRALAPLVARALDEAGLRAADLEGVAISLGPGSWTGLRIGLSAAKALAWGAGTKLVGIPSFAALALDAARRAPGCAHLLARDARGAGFFCALFSGQLPPEQWLEDSVLDLPGLLAAAEKITARHNVPLAICGDRRSQELLKEAAGQRGWSLRPDCENISAAAVAECGWVAVSGDTIPIPAESGHVSRNRPGCAVLKTAAEIHKLAPLYLRASSPEIKLGRGA
jgi:tRNA threonylcarbamoyladenosine biosynthesis protein TsaB